LRASVASTPSGVRRRASKYAPGVVHEHVEPRGAVDGDAVAHLGGEAPHLGPARQVGHEHLGRPAATAGGRARGHLARRVLPARPVAGDEEDAVPALGERGGGGAADAGGGAGDEGRGRGHAMSIAAGSSISSFTRTRKSTACWPSMSRWS
jgi:hypothetical protein